jgi:hypothetical protein
MNISKNARNIFYKTYPLQSSSPLKIRFQNHASASFKTGHKIVTFVSLKRNEITRRLLRKRTLRRMRSRGRREKKGGRQQEEGKRALI